MHTCCALLRRHNAVSVPPPCGLPQVSSKRVIDGVPMHVRHFLLRRFCKQLEQLPVQLYSQLASGPAGATAHNAIAATAADPGSTTSSSSSAGLLDVQQLMAENASTAARRAQLQHQRGQLHEVKLILGVY